MNRQQYYCKNSVLDEKELFDYLLKYLAPTFWSTSTQSNKEDCERSIKYSNEFLIQNGWKDQQNTTHEVELVQKFLQDLHVEAFHNQNVKSSGKIMKFIPFMDFDFQSNLIKIQTKLNKIREILITSTQSEGDAFLCNFLREKISDRLNQNDRELYTGSLARVFERFLPKDAQNGENYEKICNFYEGKKVLFGDVEETLFHKCALAVGNYLSDYPLLKCLKFVLKMKSDATKVYFKLHDYKQTNGRLPDYFNCTHGYEMPLLFNFLNENHTQKDQDVSVKTMNLVGALCRFDEISSEDREQLFGSPVTLNIEKLQPEIKIKNLSISKTEDDLVKYGSGDAVNHELAYWDILEFWDEIAPLDYFN